MPQPPSISSFYQHQALGLCVCCLLSQSSYYG